MTEVTLKANNFIDICSIPSKFHMCMNDRMNNIYAQNQSSIHCSCVWKAVHNRTFLNNLRTINTYSLFSHRSDNGFFFLFLNEYCKEKS